MSELSAFHQRNLDHARARVAAIGDKNTYEMDQRELRLWLTRMESVGRDLLNIVNMLLLTVKQERESREVRDDR